MKIALPAVLLAAAVAGPAGAAGLDEVRNIVVIYAENRSFDNLYGRFPGANGLQDATADSMTAARPRRLAAEGAAAGLGRADRQGRRPRR